MYTKEEKKTPCNNIHVCHSPDRSGRKEILEGMQLCWYIKESIHLLFGFFKVTCSAASIGDFSWGLFQTNWLWYSEFLGKVYKCGIFMPAFLWSTLWSWQQRKKTHWWFPFLQCLASQVSFNAPFQTNSLGFGCMN